MSFKSRAGISVGIAFGIAFATPALTAPANAAVTSVSQNCMQGTFEICTYISRAGRDVEYMKGWMRNDKSDKQKAMHIELEGPNGLIKNCPTFSIGENSNSPNCVWSPNPPAHTLGQYCTTLWQDNYGQYINWGTECINA